GVADTSDDLLVLENLSPASAIRLDDAASVSSTLWHVAAAGTGWRAGQIADDVTGPLRFSTSHKAVYLQSCAQGYKDCALGVGPTDGSPTHWVLQNVSDTGRAGMPFSADETLAL